MWGGENQAQASIFLWTLLQCDKKIKQTTSEMDLNSKPINKISATHTSYTRRQKSGRHLAFESIRRERSVGHNGFKTNTANFHSSEN